MKDKTKQNQMGKAYATAGGPRKGWSPNAGAWGNLKSPPSEKRLSAVTSMRDNSVCARGAIKTKRSCTSALTQVASIASSSLVLSTKCESISANLQVSKG